VIVAVHALTGAAFSRLCRTRRQAFALGFVSHVVCDAIPHRDLEVPHEACLLSGALAVVAGLRGMSSKEFAGAVGAAVPDIENLVGRLLDIPDEKLLLPTHNARHGRRTAGFGLQVALAGVAVGVLLMGGSCLPPVGSAGKRRGEESKRRGVGGNGRDTAIRRSTLEKTPSPGSASGRYATPAP
jgi:hypothetical protein